MQAGVTSVIAKMLIRVEVVTVIVEQQTSAQTQVTHAPEGYANVGQPPVAPAQM